MKLRTFTAKTLRAAMRAVKAELGEDAVIIATETLPSGLIEIRAAVEQAVAPDALTPMMEADAVAEAPCGPVADVLAHHGFSPALCRALTPDQGGFAAWAATLAQHVPCVDLPVSGVTLALLGPPGAGKTLLAARLAARARLAGHSVTLICADPGRMGEQARLEGYALSMDATPAAAESPAAIAAFAQMGAELTVIDLPAVHAYDAPARAHAVAVLAATGATPVLVCPAGLAAPDASALMQMGRDLGVTQVIISKCDATAVLGPVIEAVVGAGLSIAAFGQTAYLGQGLLRADGGTLARLLLQGFGLTHGATDVPHGILDLTAEQALPAAAPVPAVFADVDADLFGDVA